MIHLCIKTGLLIIVQKLQHISIPSSVSSTQPWPLPLPEWISDRTHTEDNVKVVANPFNQEGEHGVRDVLDTCRLGRWSQSWSHLDIK